MADKTGFDKFVSKQVGETVQIRPKANTRSVERDAPVGEGRAELEPERAVKVTEGQVRRHPGGRPRKDPSMQPRLVTLNFQIDEELKKILEGLKYRTHKSSVKGVIMEALDDLLDKYGIER